MYRSSNLDMLIAYVVGFFSLMYAVLEVVWRILLVVALVLYIDDASASEHDLELVELYLQELSLVIIWVAVAICFALGVVAGGRR